MSEKFVEILLPLALDRAFTYAADSDVEIGDVVQVEFGRKKIWGVVWSLDGKKEVAAEKIKKILTKNPRLKLSEPHLKFIEELAAYNLASRGLVLRSFIGILNSDKVKKEPKNLVQEILPQNFSLKKLSEIQQKIADEISTQISLIDGVTGSGKTEIYFSKIAQILQNDEQAQILILIPEIALTSQLLLRFEEQFKFKPALWHSKISKKEKREIFYGIVDGSVRVIIGARSALLLPFRKLRLIVIDEEHDSSFKQEDVFNFHARDMAILKSRIENFAVILASATPAVETYNNGISGKFTHFILPQKFGAKNEIELIDLRQNKLEKGSFLSQKLVSEIAKTLGEKKQAMLFLNRRGYAPVTLCKTCGKKYICQNCDFHLVLHKTKNRLICHHCGHFENVQNSCKSCGAEDALISIGAGVEKVEEEVRQLFPDAKIALITSDNVSDFIDAEKVVKEIISGEIDIIIGTQMIAKGHDFPNLELVGIVDADAMLYSSELRALERSFQMLTQVVGRAGRRKAGKVLIQTYNPQNLVFEKIIKDAKKDFYDFEINNRRSLDLPPFSRFAKFEVSAFDEIAAKNFAKKLISNFPISDKIEIFGPASAPLQKLKNRHHFLVNLKVQKKINLQKLILDVMRNLEIPNNIRVRIDIDPI